MLIKLGENEFMAAGKVTKDAEYKTVGAKNSPVCSFSLIAGKRKDTTTIFVNCKAWYGLANYAESICKGDVVIVVGTLEEREYNGKTYKDIVAEWLNVVEKEPSVNQTASFPSEKHEFQESEGDGKLPWD